jgi:Type II CAAX prenyl endopeptidase Rce1-like
VIQTGFEEMLFRGLIAQLTRRIVNSVTLVVLVQALIFGALHVGNVRAWGGSPLGMAPDVLAAAAWGWAAWRTGSLLVPAALRFANNAGNVLAVGVSGDCSPWLLGPGAPDRRGPRRGARMKWRPLLSWRAAIGRRSARRWKALDVGARFAGDGIEGRRIAPVQH